MNLDRVPAGKDVPHDCNVIIEIPMHGDAIKYEVDKETGAVFVDRFMATSMHYPCNYGYIPGTLSDDGDPSDVLVLSPVPLITGVVVRCRPIGMLKMDDEAGGDAKILAVPVDKLSGLYRAIQSPRDLPEITTQQIAHFFEHYKDLEPGTWVRLGDGVDAIVVVGGRGGEEGNHGQHRALSRRQPREVIAHPPPCPRLSAASRRLLRAEPERRP